MISEELAELMGIHIGDGCISITKRYSMYYVGGDLKEEKEYHDNWVSKLFNKEIMRKLNKEKVRYKEYPSTGVYGLYIFDKEITDYFMSLGICSGSKINQKIPEIIRQDDLMLKRFLRGLFDTDGNIYFDKNRSCKKPINNVPVIKLGSAAQYLIKDVFQSLKKLGFNPRLKKPYQGKKDKNPVHTVLIYRKKDIEEYVKEIGFKNPKHNTKWLLFKKQGFLQPRTTIQQRKRILGLQ